MKHSCVNCRYYYLDNAIKDERGKHVCYAYNLICSPVCLGYETEKENDCERFSLRDGAKRDDVEKEWSGRIFEPDKTTDILLNCMMKRKQRG